LISEDATAREPEQRWFAQLLVQPAAERLAFAIPIRNASPVVGRRVLCVDAEGFAERDLRAMSEPMLDAGGDIVGSLVDEADWYLWTGHSNNERHPSMRVVPIGSLWIET